MSETVGERFARALSKKDRAGLLEVLDPEVDFRGMTPGNFWEASSSTALVDVLLGRWFEEHDHIEALEDVRTGSVVDRDQLSYRFRMRTPDGAYLVEQQAYVGLADGDRIGWLRIMCSGFRPIAE